MAVRDFVSVLTVNNAVERPDLDGLDVPARRDDFPSECCERGGLELRFNPVGKGASANGLRVKRMHLRLLLSFRESTLGSLERLAGSLEFGRDLRGAREAVDNGRQAGVRLVRLWRLSFGHPRLRV